MVFSQTGFYALQSLLNLATRPTGESVPAGVIAEETGVPSNYLSKVLQRLAQEELVASSRGPGGGYRLLRDPSTVSVAEAVGPFMEVRRIPRCILGGECDHDDPCSAHQRLTEVNATTREMLERTSLADLLSGPGRTRPAVPHTQSEHTS